MFLPLKYQKNSQSTDVSFNNSYSSFSRKYFKAMKTKKNNKGSSIKTDCDSEVKSDPTSQQTFNQETNSQKSEIMKWLFSLSKTDRMKAVTIENKWLTSMICQMYISLKQQKNTIFKLKSDEGEEAISHTYYTTTVTYPFYQMNAILAIDTYFSKKVEIDIYGYKYFDQICAKNETPALEKLQIIKELNDSLMLHPDLLEEKSNFESVFNALTENKFLQYNISVNIDPSDNKTYYWSLPDWFNVKAFNSPMKIFTAFLDQILVIRYNMFLQERDKFRFSLLDTKLDDLFDQRETLINFLVKANKSRSKDKNFAKLNVKEIAQDVYKEEEIGKNSGYTTYYGIAYKYHSYSQEDSVNGLLLKMRTNFIEYTEVEFMNYLIFYGMQQDLTSFESILKERVIQSIYNLYTEQNAQELLQWESRESNDCNEKTEKNGGNSRKKKKAKNKSKSRSNSKEKIAETKDKDKEKFQSVFMAKSQIEGYRTNFNNIKQGLSMLIKESFSNQGKENQESIEKSCNDLLKKKFSNANTSLGNDTSIRTGLKLQEIDSILARKQTEDIEMGFINEKGEVTYNDYVQPPEGSLVVADEPSKRFPKLIPDNHSLCNSKSECQTQTQTDKLKQYNCNCKFKCNCNWKCDKISLNSSCLPAASPVAEVEVYEDYTSNTKQGSSLCKEAVLDSKEVKANEEFIDGFVKNMVNDLICKIEKDDSETENQDGKVSMIAACQEDIDENDSAKQKTLEETIKMLQSPSIDTEVIHLGGKKKNKKKKVNNVAKKFQETNEKIVKDNQPEKTNQAQASVKCFSKALLSSTQSIAEAENISKEHQDKNTKNSEDLQNSPESANKVQKSTLSSFLDKLDSQSDKQKAKAGITSTTALEIKLETIEKTDNTTPVHKRKKKANLNDKNEDCNKTTSDESINKSSNDILKVEECPINQSNPTSFIPNINISTNQSQDVGHFQAPSLNSFTYKTEDVYNCFQSYGLNSKGVSTNNASTSLNQFLQQQELNNFSSCMFQQNPFLKESLINLERNRKISNVSNSSYGNMEYKNSPVKIKNLLKEKCLHTEEFQLNLESNRKESMNSQPNCYSGPFEGFTNLNSFNNIPSEYINLQSNHPIITKAESKQKAPQKKNSVNNPLPPKKNSTFVGKPQNVGGNPLGPTTTTHSSSKNLAAPGNQTKCVGGAKKEPKKNSFDVNHNKPKGPNGTSKKDLKIDINNPNSIKITKANSAVGSSKKGKNFENAKNTPQGQKFRNLNTEFKSTIQSPPQVYNNPLNSTPTMYLNENTGQIQNNYFIINSNVNIGNLHQLNQFNQLNQMNQINQMNQLNQVTKMNPINSMGPMSGSPAFMGLNTVNGQFPQPNYQSQMYNQFYDIQSMQKASNQASTANSFYYQNMMPLSPNAMNYCKVNYPQYSKEVMSPSNTINLDYCSKMNGYTMYNQPSPGQMINSGFYTGDPRSNLNQTPSPSSLKKIETNVYPFTYHFKLHNDILDFSEKVTSVLACLRPFKISVLGKLKEMIKNTFDGEDVELDVYGSFETNLSIESSDIDLTIRFTKNYDTDITIAKLTEEFRRQMKFENIHPITTASVPVIKLVIDPTKLLDEEEKEQYMKFKDSEEYRSYQFNKEDLDKFKIDISFFENSGSRAHSKMAVEYIKSSMISFPEIKPLVFVLKRFLHSKNLNSSFNGGLSSYSLFIMVLSYLKYPRQQSKPVLGRMLFEFLEFFGKSIKYNASIIDCNSFNTIMMVSNETYDSFPIILDPTNSNHNVAKQSYRIEEVKKQLSNAHDYLAKLKLTFDKKDMNQESNSINDLLSSKLTI